MSYTPSQLGTVLTAADYAAGDSFGVSSAVSADGLVLAVGAHAWEGGTSNQGGVYIYDWNGAAWVQRGSVLVYASPTADEYYGTSIALTGDGNTLVVGIKNNDTGAANKGAVAVYDWSGAAWVQRGSLLQAADGVAGDEFGGGVAISSDGNRLLVGAPIRASGGVQRGAVYAYTRNGSSWTAVQTLTSFDGADYDRFGYGVSVSGDGKVLSAPSYAWEGDYADQGGVYIYDWNGAGWTRRGDLVLTAPDVGATTDQFGLSSALNYDGTKLAVGAPGKDLLADQGVVYLFEWDSATSTWSYQNTLTHDAPVAGDNFGRSVGLNDAGTVLVAGVVAYDVSGASAAGGVVVFSLVEGAQPGAWSTGLALQALAVEGAAPGTITSTTAVLPAISCTGEMFIAASGAIAIGSVGVSGEALSGLSATGAISIPAISTTGELGVNAGAVTIAKTVVSGVGVPGVVCTGSVRLKLLSVQGEGFVGSYARGNIRIKKLSVAGAALVGVIGYGVLSTPRVRVQGSGFSGLNLTGSVTLPVIKVGGEGYLTAFAEGVVQLPSLRVEGRRSWY